MEIAQTRQPDIDQTARSDPKKKVQKKRRETNVNLTQIYRNVGPVRTVEGDYVSVMDGLYTLVTLSIAGGRFMEVKSERVNFFLTVLLNC